jgi:hypothetical protein
MRRILVSGWPGQKACKIPSRPIPGHGGTPVIPVTWENTNERITVQACLGIKQEPISKITNAKRTGVSSSGTIPTQQAKGPEFKLQCHQKKYKSNTNYKAYFVF